jgi:hypothetical protein
MTFFTNLFTVKTWAEFLAAGGQVSGFSERWVSRAQALEVGDRLLCYLAGANRWVGVLEVAGPAYVVARDEEPIWEDHYPVRVPVRVLQQVTPLNGPLVNPMLGDLDAIRRMANPKSWGANFLAPLNKWTENDGKRVETALHEASRHPTETPLPRSATSRRAPAQIVSDQSGTLSIIPEREDEADVGAEGVDVANGTEHTRVQLILAQMGSEMGYSVYVPASDRQKTHNGKSVGSVPRAVAEPSLSLNESALRTIRHIDVLWLTQRAIRAAFEIESTTSIYSGLLRMSDLTAEVPGLDIACFVVAPDSRQEKVAAEILRPTFTFRERPLREYCRFVPFSALTEAAESDRQYWSHIGTQGGVGYVEEKLSVGFSVDGDIT